MPHRVLRDGWTALVGAVLPVECAGCGAPDVPLCAVCRRVLAGAGALVDPRPAPGCPAVRAVAPYEGPVRAVLVAWKDHGRSDLSRVLASCLTAAVAAGPLPAGLLLVPVPSARRAVRRRGEDLVGALARRAAVTLRGAGADVRVAPVLRHRRRVRDQAGLPAAERVANLHGALGLRTGASLASRPCILVDDVATTGATLADAARVAASAGGEVLGAAVVAATARRLPATRSHGHVGYRAAADWTSVRPWQASPRR